MKEEEFKTTKKKREKVKEYYYKNRNKVLENRKKRRILEPDYKKYQNNYQNNYHKREGRREYLARMDTYNKNEKTNICYDCKKQIKTQFHHLSYKPNVFIELCKECHIKRHKEN